MEIRPRESSRRLLKMSRRLLASPTKSMHNLSTSFFPDKSPDRPKRSRLPTKIADPRQTRILDFGSRVPQRKLDPSAGDRTITKSEEKPPVPRNSRNASKSTISQLLSKKEPEIAKAEPNDSKKVPNNALLEPKPALAPREPRKRSKRTVRPTQPPPEEPQPKAMEAEPHTPDELQKTSRMRRREELLETIHKNLNHFSRRAITESLFAEKGRFAVFSLTEGETVHVDLINVATDRRYTIQMQGEDQLSCNCPDFLGRGAKSKTNCQHIRYLVCKMLGFDVSFAHENRVADLKDFRRRLNTLPVCFGTDTALPKKLRGKTFDQLTPSDNCIFCHFSLLREDPLRLVNCPFCRGVAHLECVKCLLRAEVTRGCVFCGDAYLSTLLK